MTHSRPLVARRHYVETGNLRHFRVDFAAPGDLATTLSKEDSADGRVLVALCESAADCEDASLFARSAEVKDRKDVIVAVPQPLSGLSSTVVELQPGEDIHVEFARATAVLAQLPGASFYHRLRERFGRLAR